MPPPDPSRTFDAVVTADRRRRVLVPVPFDPDEAWEPGHRLSGA